MSRDPLRRCAECGIDFVWTAEEQNASAAPPDFCSMCRRLAPAADRQRGIVKWFNHSKGYGFITPPRGPEIFLHKSGLAPGRPLPRAGQLVEFAARAGARGLQAEEVVILEAPLAEAETSASSAS